jgi:hypothetical protein
LVGDFTAISQLLVPGQAAGFPLFVADSTPMSFDYNMGEHRRSQPNQNIGR